MTLLRFVAEYDHSIQIIDIGRVFSTQFIDIIQVCWIQFIDYVQVLHLPLASLKATLTHSVAQWVSAFYSPVSSVGLHTFLVAFCR